MTSKMLLWSYFFILVSAARVVEPKRIEEATAFSQLSHFELLLPFLGPEITFSAPSASTKPISAIVLAEMATQDVQPVNSTVEAASFEQLMVKAANRLAISNGSLMMPAVAKLPGYSFLAPNRTTTTTANVTTQTQSAQPAYYTSSISYTHTADGEEYLTALTVNGVDIESTFAGQDSLFLPEQPYMPSPPSDDKTYAQLLGDSLWFYEQNRAGLLPLPNRVAWRNTSTLHDGLDHGLDLTGGYFDAGDYVKCTFPLSATLSYMAYGALEQVDAVSAANQLGYLDQALRWGFDWLTKAHSQPDQLWVYVGNSTLDDNYWGGDRSIPEPRPAYQVNASAPGTDVAAGTAGAFAAGAVLYATALNDTLYAQRLLDHAADLYYFAESARKALYQISVPVVAASYSSSDYGDELVWGGLQLFRATGDDYYLERADYYAQRYSLADSAIGNAVDWDSKHGIALLLGAQLTAQGANTSYDYLGGLERYVDALLGQHTTPGGLLWFQGSSADASLVEAVDSAYVLFAYSSLPNANLTRGQSATRLAQSQLDYVLGDNPAGRVFITGATASSPQNPQSALAAGGSSVQTMDTVPIVEAHQLFGAMVGGPNEQDEYADIRSNYQQSEVALDYNALLTPLLAMKAGQGEVPFYAR